MQDKIKSDDVNEVIRILAACFIEVKKDNTKKSVVELDDANSGCKELWHHSLIVQVDGLVESIKVTFKSECGEDICFTLTEIFPEVEATSITLPSTDREFQEGVQFDIWLV